jgi:hypothetical protein
VHFLDAWAELSAFDLARLLAPLALLGVATFIPGRVTSRLAALGVAVVIPFWRELATPPVVTAGWVALWLVLALHGGKSHAAARRPLAASRSVLESGSVGILLGLALGLLLVTAVARQDMSAEETRRASAGALLVVIGLLHLMLRRHIRSAMVGFAAFGLGIQLLDGAAQGAQLDPSPVTGQAILLAAWLAVILASRVAGARTRYAGTAWVSDAHDLHD